MADDAFHALRTILPESARLTSRGRLEVGGMDVAELAARYGTPVQIFDEEGLRRTIRRFVDGLASRWPSSEVLFASKALPLVAMYGIAAAEGLAIDVAGEGELRLAMAAGVDPARIHLHGNAKSDAELRHALEAGVGCVIVDGPDDLRRIERWVPAGRAQRVLIRVIPGVEASTHDSMKTGDASSKFGVLPGQAAEMIETLADHPTIRLDGVHLHIGSQILDTAEFQQAVARLAAFPELDVYDVGGGLGVAYSAADAPPTIEEYLDAIVEAARAALPPTAKLLIEPGRSIVARAGITAYRLETLKETGHRFAAIDGGIADMLEVAASGLEMSAIIAERAGSPADTPVRIVGRQCESGDVFVRNGALGSPRVGDTVVVPATGAYSYTTTNNYNGALRPAVVFVSGGRVRVAARRETWDDLLALHAPALDTDWSRLP